MRERKSGYIKKCVKDKYGKYFAAFYMTCAQHFIINHLEAIRTE